ncbi:hypothetical protein H5P27_08950 [Pelagicoccus albus]|uniref:Uncharacterized protein n=2 Tax=Pelagicoccus albus TaxID=415222 RepID=A0A7X1B5S3_9BACT|nr:hypothetical protein [Pelagicoccus albus]
MGSNDHSASALAEDKTPSLGAMPIWEEISWSGSNSAIFLVALTLMAFYVKIHDRKQQREANSPSDGRKTFASKGTKQRNVAS